MTRISTYFFLLAASVFLINNQHSVKAAQGSLSARKSLPQIILKTVFKTLNFDQPVFLTHAGDGTDRIFVVEKKGVIKVFSNEENPADFKTFLDIENRVNSGKSESGLLGLAFHPKYPENGLFYVYYNYGNLYSRIAEFKVSANPDSADENSERALLELEQPYSNHNGGQVSFGPDGYLYIGLGDGGSGGDPDGNGQNPKTLLGAILRIDV
ncbi:MAG TPA: glucose sorbosone dehydrogenase, partial [Caldithrix abyssi]|nr:glucose sorbosone dehydrogenase [Caldithrix abyssi]